MSPVSFIAISFLYFFFRNPDSLICVSDDRDSMCLQKVSPVCALYSSTSAAGSDCNSPTGYCLKTMINTCEACSDPSIIGYILGDCPNVPVQTCSQEHSQFSCSAMNVPGTVCGISEIPSTKGLGELSQTVLENGCEACNAGEASFYLGGETLGECVAVSTSTICKPEDRSATSCEGMTTPVCAYYTGEDCDEEICKKTMDSNCLACLDSPVMFYFNGDCDDLVPIGENGLPPDYNPVPEEEEDFVFEEEEQEGENEQEDEGVFEEEEQEGENEQEDEGGNEITQADGINQNDIFQDGGSQDARRN